jgi:hypothetical protein
MVVMEQTVKHCYRTIEESDMNNGCVIFIL